MSCGYSRPWQSPCPDPAPEGQRCPAHRHPCKSCGAPATRDCDETMGPMICGEPLCDGCEHTLHPNGCNSGTPLPPTLKPHVKKGAQIFKLWIDEDAHTHNVRTLEAEIEKYAAAPLQETDPEKRAAEERVKTKYLARLRQSLIDLNQRDADLRRLRESGRV